MLASLHLAIFVFFASFAPGVMPMAHGGTITVELCTGEGMVEVTLDAQGNPVEHGLPACGWAVHHLVAPLGAPTFSAAVLALLPDMQPAPSPRLSVMRRMQVQNLSRGPPRFL
ncbi:hypothetical protein ACFSUD_15620 [Sulfitobacter aestuarii]|uniref:Uncharacterized protein n=1 Tax=Sulfitobacter aestuarii TaxID=2161676 RepID=A0ABW5U8C9_9RHOB